MKRNLFLLLMISCYTHATTPINSDQCIEKAATTIETRECLARLVILIKQFVMGRDPSNVSR